MGNFWKFFNSGDKCKSLRKAIAASMFSIVLNWALLAQRYQEGFPIGIKFLILLMASILAIVIYRYDKSNSDMTGISGDLKSISNQRRPKPFECVLIGTLVFLFFLFTFSYVLDLRPMPAWLTKLIRTPSCALPCWENITPGETLIKDVPEILQFVQGVDDVRGPIPVASDANQTDVVVSWRFPTFANKRGYSGSAYSTNKDHSVAMISLNMDVAHYTNASLGEMVAAYGDPEYVHTYFCDDALCGTHLIFPTKGMVLDVVLPVQGRKIEIVENSSIDSIILIPISLESYWMYLRWPAPVDGIVPIIEWQGYGEYTVEEDVEMK